MIKNKIYNMCLEEYKIIQAKIDKIGEFKFKVKGWSITLQLAALAAFFTHELSTMAAAMFFIALLSSVIFLNFIEQEQVVLVFALSNRVKILEKTLSRLSLPSKIKDEDRFMRLLITELEGTPKIGVTLRNESRRGILYIFGTLKHYKNNMFFIFQYAFLILAAIIYFGYMYYCFKCNQTTQLYLNVGFIHE